MKRCKIAGLLLLILIPALAKAQYTDSTRHYLNFGATGSLNKTNTGNSYLVNQQIGFGLRHSIYRFNANASYIYGLQNQNLTNNDFNLSVDGDRYLRKDSAVFLWVLLNYTTSFSLKINKQLQGGGGVAYDVIRKKNALLNISDGLLYENGDLFIDTLHDRYHTVRNSLRLRFRITLQNLIVADGYGFLQTALGNWNDYIINANVNVGIRLRKWLMLTTSFTYNKITRTDRYNLLVNYGLKMEKYF